MQKDRPYKLTALVFNEAGQIESNCNGLLFINQGTSAATLNQVIDLPAGAAIAIEGQQNEIDRSSYSVSFGAGVNKLVVLIKRYI